MSINAEPDSLVGALDALAAAVTRKKRAEQELHDAQQAVALAAQEARRHGARVVTIAETAEVSRQMAHLLLHTPRG